MSVFNVSMKWNIDTMYFESLWGAQNQRASLPMSLAPLSFLFSQVISPQTNIFPSQLDVIFSYNRGCLYLVLQSLIMWNYIHRFFSSIIIRQKTRTRRGSAFAKYMSLPFRNLKLASIILVLTFAPTSAIPPSGLAEARDSASNRGHSIHGVDRYVRNQTLNHQMLQGR